MGTGICALILAAGDAHRYGAPKQLQLLRGEALVRRVARAALDAGLTVTVVTGAEHDAVARALHALPLATLRNADWARGMGGSLSLAVRAPRDAFAALLVLLADQPLIGADDLRWMVAAHREHPTAIVAADHGGTLGPPCLFPPAFFDALAALDGDRGARALLREHADAVHRVAMPHASLDVDTPEDLARAEAWLVSRATSS